VKCGGEQFAHHKRQRYDYQMVAVLKNASRHANVKIPDSFNARNKIAIAVRDDEVGRHVAALNTADLNLTLLDPIGRYPVATDLLHRMLRPNSTGLAIRAQVHSNLAAQSAQKGRLRMNRYDLLLAHNRGCPRCRLCFGDNTNG
jgi:hypothetical protein